MKEEFKAESSKLKAGSKKDEYKVLNEFQDDGIQITEDKDRT